MELLEPVELYDLNGFYMEITSACNLRCLHCYNDSGVLKNQINFVDFEKIVIQKQVLLYRVGSL